MPCFPTPLATDAVHRILAWPRYDQAADLDFLARHFGPLLVGRADVCLCLRHDLTRDPPMEQAVAAVEAAFTRALGEGADVEALIVDGPLDSDGWRAVGRAVTGVLALPSILSDGDRRAHLMGLGHQLIVTTDELRAALGATATPALAVPAARPLPTAAPAVSVIVPTRDRPWFLARALDSIAAQSFRDLEVLVVNDGGAGVESVLDAFASRLVIHYVRHPVSRGPAAARNSALGLARGQYIAYLDDDDRFQPDHLRTLMAALQNGAHPVAYADPTWMLEEKGGEGYHSVRPILRRSWDFDRRLLMLANFIPLSSLVHERACLDALGGFDESLTTHEDWDFVIRLAWRFGVFRVAAPTVTLSWRSDGSSLASGNPADFQRTLRLLHERYRTLIKDDADLLARQAAMTMPTAAPNPAAIAPRP